MRKITKRSAIIAGVAVVAIGGGAAWAGTTGWDIAGKGTATGDASSIKDMSASITLGGTKVFPNFHGNVDATVSNPNDFPVVFTGDPVVPTNVTVTATSGIPSTPADCATALNGHPDLLTAAFPTWNGTVGAGAANKAVKADITVGLIPQTCAGAHIAVDFTFKGTSTGN